MGSLWAKWRGQTALFMAEYGMQYVKGDVLDAGCGNKPYLRLANSMGVTFTKWLGCDVRPVGEIQCELNRLPLGDSTFDTVLCTDTVHLLGDPLGAVRELHRVLKTGGYLVITFPGNRPENGEDIFGFRLNGIGWLLDQVGFKPLVLEGYGGDFLDEGENFLMQERTGTPMNLELFHGWLNYLDKKYPATYGVVAQKL